MFDDGYTRRLANSARLLGLTIRCPDCETATIASTGDALYDTHSKRWCVGFYCHDCRTQVPAFHPDWESVFIVTIVERRSPRSIRTGSSGSRRLSKRSIRRACRPRSGIEGRRFRSVDATTGALRSRVAAMIRGTG